jgi:hypothetical protein
VAVMGGGEGGGGGEGCEWGLNRLCVLYCDRVASWIHFYRLTFCDVRALSNLCVASM